MKKGRQDMTVINVTKNETLPYELRMRVFTTAKRLAFARHLKRSGETISRSLLSRVHHTGVESDRQVYHTIERQLYSMKKVVYIDFWRITIKNCIGYVVSVVEVKDNTNVTLWETSHLCIRTSRRRLGWEAKVNQVCLTEPRMLQIELNNGFLIDLRVGTAVCHYIPTEIRVIVGKSGIGGNPPARAGVVFFCSQDQNFIITVEDI
jgi:hypothetical protein